MPSALVSCLLCIALVSPPADDDWLDALDDPPKFEGTAEQREAAEEREAEEREAAERERERARLDAIADDKAQKKVIGGVLIGVGAAAFLAGLIMAVAGAPEAPPPVPDCTVGKLCGATCIEISDTCSIQSTSSDRYQGNLPLMVTGFILLAAGGGAGLGGMVVLVQNSRVQVVAAPGGLVLRF